MKSESQIGKWEVSLSDHGVKYKALICINEYKGFAIQINSIPMGISISKKIAPCHIGSNVIKDSYIPIMPAIQVGKHLGFPTEGYFYHFNDEKLIQEYKISGEGKCGFFGTKSRQGYLNNEREYNRDQCAFLVFGLINGEMSENQFIFYQEKQLTLSELSVINDQWLSQNGIKLDINAIIKAKTLPVIQRPVLPQEKKEDEMVHIVQVDPETNKREMWSTIAGKYGLSANELLEINSHFIADPMALKAGDKLQIKKHVKKVKEVVTGTPLEAPQVYNQPLNTYYR
ncbi:MIX and LysM peptidoglycan-binding domain-containing protein [Photobacterium damselae]|uniref:MIX and LysM peptidoglycan-binding domain-containing protein n=1 Tax=Photobacterium damselae TaxID=38293 RepID=UPI001EFC6107|nr:LysM peptidoglycan-binding domain-containing protein [Photobacterium damselae]MCG9780412.1 LysM peptidoglycan-binding domain-containing protein [Photobacterium damselae]